MHIALFSLAAAASFDGATPLTETVRSASVYFLVPYVDPDDGTPSVLLQNEDLSLLRLEVQATDLVRHELGGSFSAPMGFGAATGPDFDPDAPPTVVVADRNLQFPLYDVLAGTEILPGGTTEWFQSFAGDVDGDGHTDILGSRNVHLTLTGGWTSAPLPSSYPVESQLWDAGDVDGDGHHDLLVSTWDSYIYYPSVAGEVALTRGGPTGYEPTPLWTLDSGNGVLSATPRVRLAMPTSDGCRRRAYRWR